MLNLKLISCATISSSGKGTAVAVDVEQPIHEEQLVNSIKVSSASIRIVRPKSHTVPLAKRRLILRRDNHNKSSSSAPNAPSAAQVIVTQYIEE